MAAVAFLFAGQGAQRVGMAKDFLAASAETRALYERAQAGLGFDLARVSVEGPESELSRSDVAQPAIVACSLAAHMALRERFPRLVPAACAGLSLGEYGALVAGGVLSAEDALRLVSARGRYMQEACDARKGVMASVLGADAATIEAAVREVSTEAEPVVVANYNSPRQLVISGTEGAVARAGELLKARGARRVLPLQVAGAYHSPLMAPAAGKLRGDLARTTLAAPRVPVYANVTAKPHEESGLRTLLERQVTEPVRFAETIAAMRAAGIEAFVELGPGGVLAGLVRQIDKDVRCVSIPDLAALSDPILAELAA